MKDKKSFNLGSSSSSSSSSTYNSLNNINSVNSKVVVIKKKQNSSSHPDQDRLLFIRRLKHYFLYSKLKSLIPSSPALYHHQFGIMTNDEEGAAEMELEPHECLVERDSDEEIISRHPAPPVPQSLVACSSTITINDHHHENSNKDKEKNYDGDNDNENDGWGNWSNVEYDRENDEDEQEQSSSSRPFKPSIKIWTMEDSIHIGTLVPKDVCLTSTLFGVLEEEKLDIVFENQYRTETKVAHTIQVRMKPGYDTDALEKKLQMWAGYST